MFNNCTWILLLINLTLTLIYLIDRSFSFAKIKNKVKCLLYSAAHHADVAGNDDADGQSCRKLSCNNVMTLKSWRLVKRNAK